MLLALESHEHPMHLGVLQMFRPPAGAGPEYPRETYEAMRALTDVARTFTGHPSPTRRGTSKVRWTYDSGIDIDYHWRYLRLPAPGDQHDFFDVLGELHSSALDRRKPLWEGHLIDGLERPAFCGVHQSAPCTRRRDVRRQCDPGGAQHRPAGTAVRVSWAPQPHEGPNPRGLRDRNLHSPMASSSRPRVSFADRFR